MTVIGSNTVGGDQLRSFVERVERVRKEKKALSKDESAIFAEAKARGYDAGAIRYVLKARDMKPHDRQEAETLRDVYMHACGMASEVPLFRAIKAMAEDAASSADITDALKRLVPENGEIIVKAGGRPMRLWRDKDGEVHSEVWNPPASGAQPPSRRDTLPETTSAAVPDVDAGGAEELGRKAWRDNVPITANPFPFGDARVARWDRGWRAESGSDGMGHQG